MDVLKYKGYEGTAEVDMDRLVCRGKILFIGDLVTYIAGSPEGLQGAFEAAVDDYIETCEAIGKEPQKPFRGQFQLRISPDLHRAAALRAVQEQRSLNDLVGHALSHYLDAPCEVNHTVTITLHGTSQGITETLAAAVSGGTNWGGPHVTH